MVCVLLLSRYAGQANVPIAASCRTTEQSPTTPAQSAVAGRWPAAQTDSEQLVADRVRERGGWAVALSTLRAPGESGRQVRLVLLSLWEASEASTCPLLR